MSNRFIKSALFSALLASASLSHGMSVDGAGSIVIVPLFADTPLFVSEVTIFNPNASSTTITPEFIGMDGRNTVGHVLCPAITVPANTSVQYSLIALCGGGAGFNPGSNNGQLRLTETSAASTPFFAYARIQNNQGSGFSVEGFPAGAFEKGLAVSTGLKRIAAAPTFQSNCVVGSLNEPVSYTLQLQTNSGTVLGNTLTGNLSAQQMIAYVDIFAHVDAPAGDHTNVRALFVNSGSSGAGLIGYCTVQDNTSLGADFRMAKTFNPQDESRQRSNVVSMTRLQQNFQIVDTTKKNTHVLYLRHPDYLSCGLVNSANLVMYVKDPQGNQPVGGAAVTSFSNLPIGNATKGAVNSGVNGRWLIEVQTVVSGSGAGTYGISCQSGNGHSMLDLIDSNLARNP